MSARAVVIVLVTAGLCGCVVPSPPPAQLSVALLAGSSSLPEPGPARVAVVVDAGEDMAALSESGPSFWIGARRGAERLIGALPAETRADLFLVGAEPDADCEAPASGWVGDDVVATALARATPAGRAALAATLESLAAAHDEDTDLTRVVVFTRLSGECGGDLCAAAQALASHDVRLDLVVIGAAQPPACLAEVAHRELASVPSAWSSAPAVSFHVDSASLDPGLRLCGQAQAHPVPVPPGEASVVVQLDPPLRIARRFAPGSRWQLEVLDFPRLDPPVREWRWRELPREVRRSR